MRKTSPLVLMALLGATTAVQYEQHEKEGHCPFDAGQLVSNVKTTLNAHRLTGRWMNIFDRHALSEEHKCYGVKLMHTYAYDEGDASIHDENAMKDVERIFEYIKATNVGESVDTSPRKEGDEEPVEEPPAYENEEVDLLSFGYHIYNGFQLHFQDPNDKSIARFVHRDVNLQAHQDEDIKEHGHDGEKEGYFNEHVFDSQFKRYAQVLDTDYDNYMVLYQCFETAQYFDKESGARIPNYEAWESAKSSSINFSSWPQSSYKFDEEKVKVQPRHFENVKILWRPRSQQQEYHEPIELEGSGELHEEIERERAMMPLEYRYPSGEEHTKIVARVDELKKMIVEKVPNLDMDQYNLLDHQAGRCDYDPYDRYDAEWQDEGSNFGHMFSEGIPPSKDLDQVEDLIPESEENDSEEMYDPTEYEGDDQIYENLDDLPDGDIPDVNDDGYDETYDGTNDEAYDEAYDEGYDQVPPTEDEYVEGEQPDIEGDEGMGGDFESEGEL